MIDPQHALQLLNAIKIREKLTKIEPELVELADSLDNRGITSEQAEAHFAKAIEDFDVDRIDRIAVIGKGVDLVGVFRTLMSAARLSLKRYGRRPLCLKAKLGEDSDVVRQRAREIHGESARDELLIVLEKSNA